MTEPAPAPDKPNTFVSLFAGVGGFDLGLERSGFECRGQCEIDEHAVAVLRRHWPDTPKHHDVSTLDGSHFGPVDIVTFGSPCQDLSVAGKRRGLKGERSSLFLQAVRYIREMQEATDGEFPRFAVWENVPGAFSSNEGADFAAVLEALVGGTVRCPADGWSNAGVAFGPFGSAEWRTLDSRYFGVAQRRRRIFLVYNPRGDSAGQVLFEPEGVRWHSAAGRREGQDATPRPEGGPRGDDSEGRTDGVADGEVVGSLCARDHKGVSSQFVNEGKAIPVPVTQYGETAGTLTARGDSSPTADRGQNIVAQPIPHVDTLPTMRAASDARGPGHGARSGDTKDEYVVPVELEPTVMRQREGKPGGGKGPLLSKGESLTLQVANDQILFAPEVAQCVTTGTGQRYDPETETLIPEEREVSETLYAGRPGKDAGATGLVPVAFQQNTRDEVRMMDGDGQIVGALAASPGAKQQNYLAEVPPQVVRTRNLHDDAKGDVWLSDQPGALQAIGDTPNQMQAVWQDEPQAFEPGSIARNAGPAGEQGIAPTLRDDPGDNRPATRVGQTVRRLTPVECERLQGFPDGWTSHGDYGERTVVGVKQNGLAVMSDTQRYRQMGNAVTVNVIEWIGRGLALALALRQLRAA